MNKVKRAIIMAAGTGNRLRPVTLTTPKPLVKVNGIRMIDTIIEGLHKNDIYEIYVVVGYLKQCFSGLEKEYEGLKLIENPYYDSCNNISSLYCARDYISESIILDGDQIITNPDVLDPYFKKSGYNAIEINEYSNEWIMQVNNGKVTGCSRTGGDRGWQLFSVSRWSYDDGIKMKRQLEIEFEEKRNHQIYWDDVPMFIYFDKYELGIRPMNKDDVIEIDSIDELREIDNSYMENKFEK